MPLFGTSGGRNPQQGQQCLKNRREQGFSFKEISGSPGLHRRAGGNGQPGGSRLPGASLLVTSVGTNPSGCLESFWQSVKLVKPWFLRVWSGVINRTCLEGYFQDLMESLWKHLAQRLSQMRVLIHSWVQKYWYAICARGLGTSVNKTKILAPRNLLLEGKGVNIINRQTNVCANVVTRATAKGKESPVKGIGW